MKLEQSFEVAAPLQRVWAALIDVEHVAPCLPGASVTGRNEDGSFTGSFKVKIGPTSAAYSGKLLMEDVDESAHTATMNASGTDKRGQGGAKALIVSKVTAVSEDTTRVEVVTDYHITGRLARFGRGGMIEEISNRLLGQFADNLQASLRTGQDAGAQAQATPAAEHASAPEHTPATEGTPAPATDETPAAPGAERAQAAAAAEPGEPAPPAEAPATPAGEPTAAAAPQSPPPRRAPVESEPVEGLSLMASVMAKQIRSNPAPVIALVIGFLVALRVLRRR
ncbi:MAG TPA: SRPBCC family protein [Solirubrobacteraceae bacterium]|nr:SRPBCC family protein [Solirubrobacteraceae bacterium]